MRETRVKAAGRDWTIPSEPSVDTILRYGEWVSEQVGDPFELFDRFKDRLPEAELMLLYREGKDLRDQLRCFSLQTPVARKYLATEQGVAKLMQLRLEEQYPDITVEQAWAAAIAFAEKLMGDRAREGNGQAPGPVSTAGATGG